MKTLTTIPLAALLAGTALLATTAQAADYRFSWMMPGLQAATPAEPLVITLNAAFLPEGRVGQAYNYDFNQLTTITGGGAPDVPAYSWGVEDLLPAGLTLGVDGFLSGTPLAEGVKVFTVKAAYLASEGEQTYQLTVNPPPVPTLSALTPSSGGSLADSQITLTGSGFLEGAQVLVDGVAVATTYVSPATLTFTAPAHAVGNASVTAVNGEGQPSSNALTLLYEQEVVVLTITSDQDDYNLRSELIALGQDVNIPVDVKVVVASGVTVQATATTNAALETGLLPAGSKVDITNFGTICGKGGKGGAGQWSEGEPGAPGGPGIRVQGAAVTIKNLGNIYGGGGGGGGGGSSYNKSGSSEVRVTGGGGGGGQSCHATSGGIAFPNSGSRIGFTNQPASAGRSGTKTAEGGRGSYGRMAKGSLHISGGYGGNGGHFGQAGGSGQRGIQNAGGSPANSYAGGAGGAGGQPVVAAEGGTFAYR